VLVISLRELERIYIYIAKFLGYLDKASNRKVVAIAAAHLEGGVGQGGLKKGRIDRYQSNENCDQTLS
jgi:hypothetical protein